MLTPICERTLRNMLLARRIHKEILCFEILRDLGVLCGEKSWLFTGPEGR